ncbi:MAG: HlyD family type I secretion periplasmic adaptor subunit [Desulfobacterales bacterium]|nr:HlyD family type I secretion periplasmic adaptor subunit [Desulfobacterales bacterium]
MDDQSRILDTNPTKYIIAGFLVIALFFGGLTAWSVYFPFQGAVIAPGTVKVLGERKTVQHLEGGIIDRIFVEEGDHVEAGDTLIRLKSSKVSSNVDLLHGRLWAKQAEAVRLRAEAAMAQKIVWPSSFNSKDTNPEIDQSKSMETDIFQSRRLDLEGKIQLYESQILQLGNQIEGAKEELNSADEIIANLEEELKSKRPLLKDKYMGKTEILKLERQLSDYKGRKGKLKQDIAGTRQRIQEYQLRIVDTKNQYKENAVSRLGEITDLIFEIQEQIKPELDAKDRLEIKAPISGTVLNMQVNSEGSGVIRSGMPLLEIVPKDLSMIIEAQVRPQDIISVHKGQDTNVQLSAFQRKSTPPVKGKVVYVSADLIMGQPRTKTMPYYEAHIEVDPVDLKEKGAYLSPGMPVACYITTDKRTIISYLLGPLLRNVDTALRE